jgi:hypothetical protein
LRDTRVQSTDKARLSFRPNCPNDGRMVSRRFSTFRSVIALWKSPAVLAEEIGVSAFAARKWAHRDRIPADKWRAILATRTARESGVTAEMLTLFEARRSASTRPASGERARA